MRESDGLEHGPEVREANYGMEKNIKLSQGLLIRLKDAKKEGREV
jgi:hypothetical protein